MGQDPYAKASAQLDRSTAKFNQQSKNAKAWGFGGLVCFALGIVTGRKELLAAGIGCIGMGQATRLDTISNCRDNLAEVDGEIAAVKRDEWRMQRALQPLLPVKSP